MALYQGDEDTIICSTHNTCTHVKLLIGEFLDHEIIIIIIFYRLYESCSYK